MSIIREILKWAQGLPAWQSDAVSRLFNKQILDIEDIDHLLAILKSEYGLPDPKGRKAEPLSPDKIPAETKSSDHIKLLAIKNLRNVNAISENQKLEFSPQGLTVVYGDNGSGKSGYTRVMKRACRARDQVEKILPNAKLPALQTEKAEGVLEINHNGEVRDERWKDGDTPPDLLSAIAIFDQRCARAYLDEADDFQFIPYGLDIFNGLAEVFNQLKERLEDEQAQCVVDLVTFEVLRGPTAVGKLIAVLSGKTNPEDVELLATMTPEEIARHQEINKSLNEENPKVKSAQIRRQANRFSRVLARANQVLPLINDGELSRLQKTEFEYDVAKAAADLAAKNFAEESQFLPGTGGPVWKSLFEAARKFSEEACPDKPFPNVEKGALCPLCQQPLVEGVKHLSHFNKYIQQEAERIAVEKLKALKAAEEAFKSVDISLPLDEETLAEIAVLDKQLSEDTDSFAKSITVRYNQMKMAFLLNDWDKVSAISGNPASRLQELVEKMNGEVETLEKVADSETRLSLETEFKELDARIKLTSTKQIVLESIAKMDRHDKISACISALNTRPISLKAKELTEKVVSEELKTALNNEFKALGVGNLEVILESKSDKGKPLHKLKLNLPQAAKKLGAILSEGEQRAIAIASFMAEITLSGSSGGIVFDDPVSSLDHLRRERVSKRLVEEAKKRQVIIFTHDVYFLGLLDYEATQADISFKTQSLSQGSSGFGIVGQDLPFQGKNTKSRIGKLKDVHQEIEIVYRKDDVLRHREMTLNAYGQLRDTWERAVEELLFGGVVVRYRKGVETGRLRGIVVELPDYEKVDKGMSKCSNYRHDNPAIAGIAIPDPDELLADIEELDEWRRELIDRETKTKKARN